MAFDVRRLVGAYESCESSSLPPWLKSAEQYLQRQERIHEPRCFSDDRARLVLGAHRDLNRRAVGYSARRQAERALAEYIQTRVLSTPEGTNDQRLHTLVEAMRTCRCSGTYGITEEGRPVVFWDSKCECSLLCPDESREEQRRLVDRYVQELLTLKKQGHRIYKAVLTAPNFPKGKLAYGQRWMFRRLRALLRARKNGRLLFPEIKGALAIEEDPLASRGDWNVHLNVIFVTDRWFDYTKLRQWWHWQVEIIDESKMRKLTADRFGIDNLSAEDLFRRAFAEVVKYPIQIIPEKSKGSGSWDQTGQFHTHAGAQVAPAMTEWPPDAWLEWWYSHQKFRRTRSYGCLYNIEIIERNKTDMSKVEILGTVKYGPRGYEFTIPWLGLIRLGDNFATKNESERRTTDPPDGITDLMVEIFQDDCRRAVEKHARRYN